MMDCNGSIHLQSATAAGDSTVGADVLNAFPVLAAGTTGSTSINLLETNVSTRLGYPSEDLNFTPQAPRVGAPRLASSNSAPATLAHPLAGYSRRALEVRLKNQERELLDMEIQRMDVENYIWAKKASIQDLQDYLRSAARSSSRDADVHDSDLHQHLTPSHSKGKEKAH
ncbi:hypothetical protein QCA50_016960 [Cerrena zonata]|uniref:Uncharacterized protein n=1 Tax=Cerrena zonata TaxID=2478898 RepID=A0AAW0FM18_9APHY